MGLIEKFERKFGRFAIKNLTLILIGCYVIGYILNYFLPNVIEYLTLDPYCIIHGQVWRLISWILIPPPEDNMFLAIIMLVFYLSIGTELERRWGAFHYNCYIFSGMIFTVLGSFLLMFYCQIKLDNGNLFGNDIVLNIMSFSVKEVSHMTSVLFSTFYVNMSIFLAYACTFPDNVVLLFFLVPVKVKILGFIYGGFILFEMIDGMVKSSFGFAYPFVIGSSLLNFVLFFFTTRKYILNKGFKTKTQRAYNAKIRNIKIHKTMQDNKNYFSGITKHKCAVCGRTEKDGDDLVFRFCSKCDGNYEYCQDHLYTHIHFTKSE